jgi:hypothetical protein
LSTTLQNSAISYYVLHPVVFGEIQLAETLLFVGTMLVAFQYVSDIGYIATLFSMPFALPIKPLMKKLGLSYKRVSPVQLGFQIDQPTERTKRNKLILVYCFVNSLTYD